MLQGILDGLLNGLLARYAAAMAGSAVSAIAGFVMAYWGFSPKAATAFAIGVVSAVAAVISALSKNKSLATILSRFPLEDVLHTVADIPTVRQIQVRDPALADAVPSPKVVVGPVPEGVGTSLP